MLMLGMLTADADNDSSDDADDADEDAEDADADAGDDAMLLRSSSTCEADWEINYGRALLLTWGHHGAWGRRQLSRDPRL